MQRCANLDLDYLGALLSSSALQLSPTLKFCNGYAADSRFQFNRSHSVGIFSWYNFTTLYEAVQPPPLSQNTNILPFTVNTVCNYHSITSTTYRRARKKYIYTLHQRVKYQLCIVYIYKHSCSSVISARVLI